MNPSPVRRIVPSLFSWLRLLPLLGLAALLATNPARATSIIAPDFNHLVSQSDYIVRGVVKSVTSEMRTDGGRRHIITKVEVEVRQTISGTPPQPLVLQMLGGTVGEETMTVEGAPKFKVGDEDILFIHGNGVQLSPLVAMMHGRYPVLHDSAGREYVARSNGAPLFSEQEIGQPVSEHAAAASTAPGSSQPLSPVDFVNRIHAAISQNSSTKLQN